MAAEGARRVHNKWRGSIESARTEEKGPGDYVSEVDREAQDAALAIILARHPDHLILAEEDAEEIGAPQATATGSTPLWIVDPLDGTANYLHGHPMSCVSVALAVDGEPIVGVVVQPETGERWWAVAGHGAWKNGRPIRVSTVTRFDRALIGTGFPFKFREKIPAYVMQLGRVLQVTAGVRRAGSAALDLCYLAQGSIDAFWELVLHPWDFAAGFLILREAGGVATRLDGSKMTLESGSWLAANSPEFREALYRAVTGEANP